MVSASAGDLSVAVARAHVRSAGRRRPRTGATPAHRRGRSRPRAPGRTCTTWPSRPVAIDWRALGLPREELVGQSLEGLADHHERRRRDRGRRGGGSRASPAGGRCPTRPRARRDRGCAPASPCATLRLAGRRRRSSRGPSPSRPRGRSRARRETRRRRPTGSSVRVPGMRRSPANEREHVEPFGERARR